MYHIVEKKDGSTLGFVYGNKEDIQKFYLKKDAIVKAITVINESGEMATTADYRRSIYTNKPLKLYIIASNESAAQNSLKLFNMKNAIINPKVTLSAEIVFRCSVIDGKSDIE